MAFIFVILGIILLIPDAYIVFGVLGKHSWWAKGLFLLPTIAYYVVLLRVFMSGDIRQSMLNLLFWLTLCIVFPTVIFAVISLIGKGIGLFWHSAPFFFNIVALCAGALWLAMSLYGIVVGWKKVTVENVEIRSPKIPQSFDGYKIVQLSDFHIGTYASSPSTVKRIVEQVNALAPDLILFTGDFVNSSASEVDEFKSVLSQLHAKDGIYSVLGNHDYCLYREYKAPDTPEKQLVKLIANEHEIGWKLLRNEAIQIVHGNDSIAIVGVDNAGSRMFPDKSDLSKATKGLSPDEYKILLSHDPSHWRREVLPSSDIDLMLAGHTHAMQFKIGNWSPSKWTYPEWGGLYQEGDRLLYVSTGIGENIAFRFGAWPQIVQITLQP
ncbi:MAG: metallophosphoesterase [Bacteroides sp.]|nr:metallophosphoesterase [Bacteroides sp.]